MTGLDRVIRGGLLVSAVASFRADIAIAGGKVVAIGEDLSAPGAEVIDASGLLVMPGAIDVHTHFETGVGDMGSTADDYESGSRAAAAGGITTFVNFAFQDKGQSLRAAVERETRKADGRSHIDYGFHVVVTDPDQKGVLDEIGQLADEGFASLKVFTAVADFQLTDGQLLRGLQRAADSGVMVNVHAEDGPLIEHLTGRLLAEGKTQVWNLPISRPPITEALATTRVAAYGQAVGCAVYFVHLSSAEALEAVHRARVQGAEIYVETRPVYLFLDESLYELPDREGNKYVSWPPLRSKANQDSLWSGMRKGEIHTYATDHTTWMAAQKMEPSASFADIPGGMSNVQTSVGMLYVEGVKLGRISANQFVALTATNPAKLFGMWPEKGTLAVGSDADLILIDPEHEVQIKSSEMQSRSDFDPYEGYVAKGWPVLTMSRGDVIVHREQVKSTPGRGRLLRRRRYQAL